MKMFAFTRLLATLAIFASSFSFAQMSLPQETRPRNESIIAKELQIVNAIAEQLGKMRTTAFRINSEVSIHVTVEWCGENGDTLYTCSIMLSKFKKDKIIARFVDANMDGNQDAAMIKDELNHRRDEVFVEMIDQVLETILKMDTSSQPI